jgi:hypothetical protein
VAALEPVEEGGVWDCLADQLWEEAECLAAQPCDGGGRSGDCAIADCEGDTDFPNIARYCGERPACEPLSPQAEAGGSVPSKDQLCDGFIDCLDGSDEPNCSPGAAIFHCASGDDVAPEKVCDGSDDCNDGSDESCL